MPTEKDLSNIKQLLDSAENNIRLARSLMFSREVLVKSERSEASNEESESVVEGIFDGERMVTSSGKTYSVPANYASKSKLVTGDTLKLTIPEDGSFIFKQIGPVERKKLVGLLEDMGDNVYTVTAGGTKYRVLAASITYFKAKIGDRVSILVPEDSASEWAAVENII
ncbi:MAG: hypothetical protein WC227_02700 [Patescibacteria group bacterium]|jgi:hypothetical protein